MAHLQSPPPRPSVRAREISGLVEAVILRALEKEPDNRFASARELATALADFKESGDPVVGATVGPSGSEDTLDDASTKEAISLEGPTQGDPWEAPQTHAEREGGARDAVDRARKPAGPSDLSGARALLEALKPSHELTDKALAALEKEADEKKRQEQKNKAPEDEKKRSDVKGRGRRDEKK
jgi:hypothetical protein